MDDITDAQVNGMLFGQTIAERVLGIGNFTREQLNEKYRELYQQIADGSLTLADTDAEIMLRIQKDLPAGRQIPVHVTQNIAAVRSHLQQAQRNMATRVLKLLNADAGK